MSWTTLTPPPETGPWPADGRRAFDDERRLVLIVRAQLSMHKGNKAPYFSLTGEIWRATKDGNKTGRDCESCGCIHEPILEAFPDLAPLAALHLSDIDGGAIHMTENGLYWLAGASETIHHYGQRYHGGSGTGYDAKSTADCVRIAADHFRITEPEVQALVADLNAAWSSAYAAKLSALVSAAPFASIDVPPLFDKQAQAEALGAVKGRLVGFCLANVDRWRKEAAEAIERFALKVVNS